MSSLTLKIGFPFPRTIDHVFGNHTDGPRSRQTIATKVPAVCQAGNERTSNQSCKRRQSSIHFAGWYLFMSHCMRPTIYDQQQNCWNAQRSTLCHIAWVRISSTVSYAQICKWWQNSGFQMPSIRSRYLQGVKRPQKKNGSIRHSHMNMGTSHWSLLETCRRARPWEMDSLHQQFQ